ncbi:MAG TPA: aldo/keto reductase [Candidatus Fimisoma avicola]|uniref:Aldo/keto reductase n=1 Tax=Candidatus Fimisoma avicola TaxID=2840826 RepID=A0A9D1I4Y1_9FIRM|nr:aldo/keto reductase [Candidatus Fimisoma avicola]
MEYRTLANGVKMPMLGYGVFQVRDHEQCRQVVKDAISVGYRLIDTAQSYMNQKAVGEAIRESGVAREEIFLTTKIWMQDNSYEKCRKAVDLALSELDTDYIDLLLLHQPMGDYYGAWRALEEAYEAGKVRAIGMANCYPQIIADMCETVRIRPMVNQMEMHPFFQQQLNVDTMDSYGVVPEAWGPFNEGKRNFFTDPILTEIGAKYGKSAAQVALRWNIQRGVVVIPKSVHKDRMEQNFDVFDFELSAEDMEKIKTMDIGHSEIIDHTDPALIKSLHAYKVHEEF